MFPEDFFGSPNQFKTIQTQISKNKEHPKIINPTLLKTKTNQPYIMEIKEEICEESLEIPKNKLLLFNIFFSLCFVIDSFVYNSFRY